MSGRGPSPADIIGGIFLILFGLFGTFLGGGCSVLLISVMLEPGGLSIIPMLLIALAVLAGGITCIWAGIKLFRGRIH